MNIYELTQQALEIQNRIMDSYGEIDEETAAMLEINEQDCEDKLESYCKIITNLNGKIGAVMAERNRLDSLVLQAEKTIERMKTAMLTFMTTTGRQKMHAGTFTVGTRKSSAVIVDDEATIDRKFIKVLTKESVDKTAIKDAIKAGEDVAGAHIEERKSLTIK